MGIKDKRIWECDRCGTDRTLDELSHVPDGWGEIRVKQYNLEGQDVDTYLCAHCLAAVITLLHEISGYERAQIERENQTSITQPDPQATGGGEGGYRPSLGSDSNGGKTFNPTPGQGHSRQQ